MRFRLWNFILGLLVGSFLSYIFVSNNDQRNQIVSTSLNASPNARQLKCLIDEKRKLNCLTDNTDVYLPFNKFIRKQFDVYGRVVDGKSECVEINYGSRFS